MIPSFIGHSVYKRQATITPPNPTVIYKMFPGEYVTGILNVGTGVFSDIVAVDIISTSGIPHTVSGIPGGTTIVDGYGGPHHMCVFSSAGDVWCKGSNPTGNLGDGSTTDRSNFVAVPTDSAGNTFTNVIQVQCGATNFGGLWNTAALKSDGTVWVWGNTQGGIRGNGTSGAATVTRPVQVTFPGGVNIVKIMVSAIAVALADNGDVYTWGGNGINQLGGVLMQGTGSPVTNLPTKITLPSPAKDITACDYYIGILMTNGSLAIGTCYTGYAMIGVQGQAWNTYSVINTPRIVDTAKGLMQSQITSIYSNDNGFFALCQDSTAWFWGDDICGTSGTGFNAGFDWLNYFNGAYNWTQGRGSFPMTKPHQIAPGKHNFVQIFTGHSYCFSANIEDANGQLYAMGRNKTAIAGNGLISANPIAGNIGGQYPNAWDIPWIEPIFPYRYTAQMQMSSYSCVLNSGATACNTYTIPTTSAPNINAGADQIVAGNTTNLVGTSSGNGGAKIAHRFWTQISGPNTASMPIRTYDTVTLLGLAPGTYVFKDSVIDQNFRTATDIVQITVNALNSITIPVGARIRVL